VVIQPEESVLSLLVDNNNTYKGDYDLTNWRDRIDGVCSVYQTTTNPTSGQTTTNGSNTVEVDRNLTAKDYFFNFEDTNPAISGVTACTDNLKQSRSCNSTTQNTTLTNVNSKYNTQGIQTNTTGFDPVYVIKGNTIEFKATNLERNQRIIMGYRYKDGSEQYQLNPTSTNVQSGSCTNSSTGQTSDNISGNTDNQNNTIPDTQRYTTRFKDSCSVAYSFNFPDDGRETSKTGTTTNDSDCNPSPMKRIA
jgi:hypothetical protein